MRKTSKHQDTEQENHSTASPTYHQLPTCTATPKLLPSSILGIWSCTHIDTCQENLNLFISSGIYEFVTVFTAIPVIKIPIQLHLKQVKTLKKGQDHLS